MDPTDRNSREGVLCWRLELVTNSGVESCSSVYQETLGIPIVTSLSIYGSILLDAILVILSDIEYFLQQMGLQASL